MSNLGNLGVTASMVLLLAGLLWVANNVLKSRELRAASLDAAANLRARQARYASFELVELGPGAPNPSLIPVGVGRSSLVAAERLRDGRPQPASLFARQS